MENLRKKGEKIPRKGSLLSYLFAHPGPFPCSLLYLGGTSVAGGELKDTEFWAAPNTGATNNTGFTARPGGYREYTRFLYMNNNGVFWSSIPYADGYAMAFTMVYDWAGVNVAPGMVNAGFSVRCIKD